MKRPNLLIVLCDQLRRQALSCYGETNLQTPALDRFASEGVRFDAANSSYPICVPFRFTFMTGEYAHSRMVPGIGWRMSPTERTLADDFNDAGYDTIYVGKWHLYGGNGYGLMKKPIPRDHQGRWSKWCGFEFRNSFFDTVWFEDDDPKPHPIDGYQTDGLFDVAMDQLRRRRGEQPFCCVLSVEAPHPPYEAPLELEQKWLQRDLELPPNFMVKTEVDPDSAGWSAPRTPDDRDEVLRTRRIYYAMVENLDQNMARLRQYLDDEGLADNTIVLFVSDHGEHGGAHSLAEKQYPYEESAGIPLLVWGPGCGIAGGRTVAAPVATEDLFPTFLGLCGLSAKHELHGADASPLARGDRDGLDRPGVMLEFVREFRRGTAFWNRVWRGFRSERYKYTVFGNAEDNGMQPWQFFDLQEDPYELNNLVESAEHRDLVAQHHRWLRERMIETGDEEWLGEAFGIESLNAWRAGLTGP